MSIDRGDSHFEEAGSWERACQHIALYLWWAAERGLAGEDVDRAAIAKAPVKYFIGHCDAKLWDEDFNDEGVAFAKAHYETYLKALDAHARELGIGSYDHKLNKPYFFALLDELLTKWRAKTAKSTKSAKSPTAKAKAKKAKKAKAKAAKPSKP